MIFGRENEKKILDRLFTSKRAEFLAIYGRRRIGKTYLIYEFFKNKGVYFEITGVKKASKKEQINRFFKNFTSKFPGKMDRKPEEWSDVFDIVKDFLETLDPSQKFILFFDELPWLASPKSGFLPALDYAWNHDLSRFPNVLLIVCGSSASWIIKKIINDKGGLYGRLSAKIRLKPFSLFETEQFLLNEGIHLKRKQLVELYMTMGGVAKYLINIPQGKSATQIINELCFSPQGFLFSEFSELYHSLFDGAENHMLIVRTLAKKRKGVSLEELVKLTKLSRGGRLSDILEELEESGFILRMPAFGKASKDRKIRLIDEYTYFYLSWIEKKKPSLLRSHIQEGDHWSRIHKTAAWYEWSRHCFESICIKHIDKIKNALGISGVITEESHFRCKDSEIDLLIDREDDCINLCEIKFCQHEFIIDKEYAEKLERKRKAFQETTRSKKTLFITLITPFGTATNEHYLGVVDQQLTLDDLF